MHTLQAGYRGFSLLMALNWDRFIYVGTIGGALLLGAWAGNQF